MTAKRNLSIAVIFETAERLVEEQGLEQLTAQRLADALGVKPASLYNHIAGLEDVQRHLAMLSIRQLYEAFLHAAAGRARDDAVREIALAYRQYAREHPQLYKAFIRSAALKNGELGEAYHKAGQVMRQVLNAYCCPEETVAHISRGLRSALHGFVSLEAAGYFQGEASADESFLSMVNVFLFYLNHSKEQES